MLLYYVFIMDKIVRYELYFNKCSMYDKMKGRNRRYEIRRKIS